MSKQSAPSPGAALSQELRHDIAALREEVATMATLLARIPRVEVSRFPPGDEHLRQLIEGLTAERDMLRAELRRARTTVARQVGELATLTGLNVNLRGEIGTLEGQLREARDALAAAASAALSSASPGHAEPAGPLRPASALPPPSLPTQLSLSVEALRGTGIHAVERGAGGSFVWFSPEIRLDISGLVARLGTVTFDLVNANASLGVGQPLARLNETTCATELQLEPDGRGQLRIAAEAGAGQGGPLILELLFERHISPPGDDRKLTVACCAMHLAG